MKFQSLFLVSLVSAYAVDHSMLKTPLEKRSMASKAKPVAKQQAKAKNANSNRNQLSDNIQSLITSLQSFKATLDGNGEEEQPTGEVKVIRKPQNRGKGNNNGKAGNKKSPANGEVPPPEEEVPPAEGETGGDGSSEVPPPEEVPPAEGETGGDGSSEVPPESTGGDTGTGTGNEAAAAKLKRKK